MSRTTTNGADHEPLSQPAAHGRTSAAERQRLVEQRERATPWWRWGPYLSERQWGTVREDYSPGGTAWDSFPHDHARSRAYRWGEDGLLGISDNHGRLCFSVALWNEHDPILKERLFGLTGPEGNHGEDVKEYYFYLDARRRTRTCGRCTSIRSAPFRTRSWSRKTARRGKDQPEYELVDTGIFAEDRYFDVAGRVRQGQPDRPGGPHHARPTAAPKRRRCTCCRRCGSATPGRGAHLTTARRLRQIAPGVVEATARAAGYVHRWPATVRPRCCSPRTRPTPSGCGVCPIARRT